MKVVIATESPVDEAAIRVLIGAVLGAPVLGVNRPPYGIRSWPGLLHIVKAVYLDAFFQTDADGLVLVADSDFSPLHAPGHESSAEVDCRLCLLREALAKAARGMKGRPCGSPLRTAVGLTIPEISAWYLHGQKHEVNETAWAIGLRDKKYPYSKQQLKTWAFGKQYQPPDEAIRIATHHAARVSNALPAFEKEFPIGFGSLANELRGWDADTR